MRSMTSLIFALCLLQASLAVAQPTGSASRWTLKSPDTEIELGMDSGSVALLSLRAPGAPWNWVQQPNKEAMPDSVIVAGKKQDLKWTFVKADFNQSQQQVTFTFKNDSPALELASTWRAPRGRGPIEHSATLINRSASNITIGSIPSLKLGMLAAPMDKYIESTQVRRGGANVLIQGGILTQTVSPSWAMSMVSRPSDGGGQSVHVQDLDAASQVPFLSFQVEAAHGLYIGWKFSGVGEIVGKAQGSSLDLTLGLAKDFVTDIFPGETFLIPAAFVGTYVGDQQAGSYSIHRYVMETLLPPRGPAPFPTLAYNYYLDGGEPGTQDEAKVLASARLAHELGFETFVADAMWFPESGDWQWEASRFPRGAKPLADYLHGVGMKFGLWMAWTHGSRTDTPTSMNYERHPDWFTAPPRYQPTIEINWESQIDVGNDEARDWVAQQTQRAMREYKLDYLKTDYSPIAVTSLAQRKRGNHQTDVSYWSTLGYYSIQRALLQKFPGMTLEGCSAGGRIKDFGNIEHVHHVVGTDTLSALADRQSVYDTTIMFPPATIQLYTYESFYSLTADVPEPYLWRSGMMGAWQIDLTQSGKLTPQQKAAIKRSTEVYKSWIRPVLADAKVHRILPRADGWHWDGLFYWNDGIKRGTAYIFRPNSERARQRIQFLGLDPDASYRVRGEDGAVESSTQTGRALMEEGVLVSLPAKFTSELIYVEAAT